MQVNESIDAHIELCYPKLADLLGDERVIKSESTSCLRDFLFFGFLPHVGRMQCYCWFPTNCLSM